MESKKLVKESIESESLSTGSIYFSVILEYRGDDNATSESYLVRALNEEEALLKSITEILEYDDDIFYEDDPDGDIDDPKSLISFAQNHYMGNHGDGIKIKPVDITQDVNLIGSFDLDM